MSDRLPAPSLRVRRGSVITVFARSDHARLLSPYVTAGADLVCRLHTPHTGGAAFTVLVALAPGRVTVRSVERQPVADNTMAPVLAGTIQIDR